MGPTFSTILNEFWTDFLQFSAKDGGVSHPPPNVRPCVYWYFTTTTKGSFWVRTNLQLSEITFWADNTPNCKEGFGVRERPRQSF